MISPYANKLTANSLNLLRFPLALLVVLIHVFSVSPSTFKIITVYDSFSFIIINRFINIFLLGIPVPVYFFISGYFFFSGYAFTLDVYKNKLKNRFHTLFIPYIVWNAAAILVVVLKDLPIFSSLLTFAGTGVDLDFNNILSCFWEYNGRLSPPPIGTEGFEQYVKVTPYPINTALWYIRDLMIIVLFSPIIRMCIYKWKKYFVFALAFLYCLSTFIPLNPHLYQLLTGVFFFSWGAYSRLNVIDLYKTFYNRNAIILLLYIVNGFICFACNDNCPHLAIVLKVMNSILAVGVLFNIAFVIGKRFSIEPKPKLAHIGYFIYISHCIISARFTKLLIMLIHPVRGYEITMVYVLSAILVIVFLYFIYMAMLRFTPRLLRIVIGGK